MYDVKVGTYYQCDILRFCNLGLGKVVMDFFNVPVLNNVLDFVKM